MVALIATAQPQFVELNAIHRQNDLRQHVLESGVRRVRGDFELVWRIAKPDKE